MFFCLLNSAAHVLQPTTVWVLLSTTYHIAIYRDPWDRLVSAYLNKAVKGDGYYSKNLHSPCKWFSFKDKRILTFPEFVDCILITAKDHHPNLVSRQSAVYLDIHWMPQVHLSLPCTTNYTLISQYNRFQMDAEFVVKYLKLNATIPVANQSKRKDNTSLSYYYKKLAPAQLKGLQELYTHDFKLFGFNRTIPSDWLKSNP